MKEFDQEEQLDMPTLNMDEPEILDDELMELLSEQELEESVPDAEQTEEEIDTDTDSVEEETADEQPDEEVLADEQPVEEEAVEETADEELTSEIAAKKKINWRKSLLVYAHDVLYLLAILIVASLFLRVVVVSGTSMTNTLKDGDYLLVLSNVFYREPKQGDIIVASKSTFDDGKPIVKRVIATEGQTVDIDFELGIVYVDGIALDEPYTKTPTTLQEGVTFPLVVEEDCIFVLGDNRNGSRDSRYPGIGMIHKKEVIGKVLLIFLPGTNGTDIYGNPIEPRDFRRIGVPD